MSRKITEGIVHKASTFCKSKLYVRSPNRGLGVYIMDITYVLL